MESGSLRQTITGSGAVSSGFSIVCKCVSELTSCPNLHDFTLITSISDTVCGHLTSFLAGYVKSFTNDEGVYENDVFCIWNINTPSSGILIQVYVVKMDIEESPNCLKDNLQVTITLWRPETPYQVLWQTVQTKMECHIGWHFIIGQQCLLRQMRYSEKEIQFISKCNL